MEGNSIFIPVLLNILLTLFVYIELLRRKKRAVKQGTIDRELTALHENAWTDDVIKVNNNLHNQFELPILFYVVSIIFWAIHAVSNIVLFLSWVFVASRFFHAYFHMGSNYIPMRRGAFIVGSTVLSLQVFIALSVLIF